MAGRHLWAICEELPPNAPSPCGQPICHTCFFDANLMHDVVTGWSATGLLHMLHMLNQTPTAWTSAHQNQVEMATYGSELMAVCQAIEQVIDIHYTLHMLGDSLDGPTWVLGDNQAIINSTTILHSSLSKCWNTLSYHCCHDSVAAGIYHFEYLCSIQNPSCILTKNLPWAKACAYVERFLLWKGETMSSSPSDTSHQKGVTGQVPDRPYVLLPLVCKTCNTLLHVTFLPG